jgi:hypothetical protein
MVGLRGHMILRAMPDRSKVTIQTKRDTLALQIGGWAWGWWPHPVQSLSVEKLLTIAGNRKRGQGSSWTVATEEEEEEKPEDL